MAKAARDAITDDNDGVPNLCGKKGLTTDIATVYKCMFRLGKSPTKLAIIVIGGGKRHPVSLAQLGELLNSIMEDARQEVIDQMMQEGKKAKVPSVPDVNSSFDLDQECLLVIGVARCALAVYPLRLLGTLTAFSLSLAAIFLSVAQPVSSTIPPPTNWSTSPGPSCMRLAELPASTTPSRTLS